MTALQTILVISCSFIYLSITGLFAYLRHQSKKVKSLQLDPPANDMHLEILVRNKYTHNWIKASAGIVLLRPDEYDLWMPK